MVERLSGPYSLTLPEVASVAMAGTVGLGITTYLVVERNDQVAAAQSHIDQQVTRVTNTANLADTLPVGTSPAQRQVFESIIQKDYNNQQQTLFNMQNTAPNAPGIPNDLIDCAAGFLFSALFVAGALKFRRWAAYELKQMKEAQARQQRMEKKRQERIQKLHRERVISELERQFPKQG